MKPGLKQVLLEPPNRLILLGLICQGFSLGNYLVPAVYAALGLACMRWRRPGPFIPGRTEDLVTLAAILAAFAVGGDYGYNKLVFVGNAMVLYQCMRLLRPLDLREKMYSLAVALIHVAVGTQVLVDYPFILVLAAVIYLLPRTLADLEAERTAIPASRAGLRVGRSMFLGVAAIMTAFFLICPRIRVFTYANPLAGQGARRARDELDMADGGSEAGDALLFRVEGADVSYVKRTALDVWDGRTWTQSRAITAAVRLAPRWQEVPETALRRTVRVLRRMPLGNCVPVDRHVLRVRGPFLQRPYVAAHGGVALAYPPRREMTYEYWCIRRDPAARLAPRERSRCLQLPAMDDTRLADWLRRRLGAESDPRRIALVLAEYFRENHTYELGAPNLDRSGPVADFVLNQRAGHCERFASALAVLLRMRGVPARVALGWVATEKNELGGFYNVRSRHGHAWTEAWIDGVGWTICDGTPYGREIGLERRPLGLTLYEWIEFVWYAKIVEFDVSDQERLAAVAGRRTRALVTAARQTPRWLTVTAGILAVATAAAALRRREKTAPRPRAARAQHEARESARHFYARLLRMLARQRLRRQPGQTPLQFLQTVEQSGHPGAAEIRELTERFCEIRYGHRPLTPAGTARVRALLERIAEHQPGNLAAAGDS